MTKAVIYKTYNEWFQVNRHVRKGEKSSVRNKDDVCVFSEEQTDPNPVARFSVYDYMDDDDADADDSFDMGADF